MDITLVIIGLLIVLAAVLVAVVMCVVRWRRVLRIGGVNVALRWRIDGTGGGWHLGIGRYRGEQFAWYRVLSLRKGADRVFTRSDLEIAERRKPDGAEVYALPSGATVLRCESEDHEVIEIAMGPGTLTGFLSWLESAPPGHQVRRAS
jgi:hypothetical protein